jgi:hypothetical protein
LVVSAALQPEEARTVRSKNPRRRFLRQLETLSRNNCGRKLGFASMINNEVIDFADTLNRVATQPELILAMQRVLNRTGFEKRELFKKLAVDLRAMAHDIQSMIGACRSAVRVYVFLPDCESTCAHGW